MRFFSRRVKPFPSPKHSPTNPDEELWTNEAQTKKELAEKRIRKELKRRNDNPSAHISYELVADHDIFQMQGTIIGPSDTPFEGGVFLLSIKLPYNYPFKPPKIVFQTKVFHPNIDKDGTIHMDILGNNWSPALTIEKMLLSICSFLDDPNPEDPLNPICHLYRNERETYFKKAREWTKKYAMA